MIRKFLIGAGAAAGAVLGVSHAAMVTTFTYSGQAQGGSLSASTNTLPAGGVLRADDPQFNFSAAVGIGIPDPLVFNVGAASAGKASASSDMTVTIQITNNSRFQRTGSLGALIFGGAVGIANPNFADPSCSTAAIEACGAFVSGTPPVHAGENADLSFLAQLNGATLFGGDLVVNSSTMNANFTSGFALTGFGVDPTNGNLFSWQDTLIPDVGLGTFAPGETKTLTYVVSANVATSAQFPCKPPAFQCPLAISGFGDPPPGNGGVIITSTFERQQAAALNSFRSAMLAAGASNTIPLSPLFTVTFDPVPLPPAVFLFGAGLAAFGAVRRRKAA